MTERDRNQGTSVRRPTARPSRSRRRVLAVAGVVLAVLAEASTAGLLGLSGWFIAASAAAGIGLIVGFSYLEPSGGVRAFAISRVAANYGQQITQHRVALERLTDLRLDLLTAAARGPRTGRRLRDGEKLDRVMVDADVVSRRGIDATTPLTVFTVVAVAAFAAIWIALPPAALVFAGGVLLCAAIAVVPARRGDSDARIHRAQTRGEIVAAIGAWPEMAALGAVPLLRARAEVLIDTEARAQRKELRGIHSREAAVGAVEAFALGGVGAVAAASGSDAPTVAFIVLLTVAIFESARRLGQHVAALRAARAARLRLVASEADDPLDHERARAALALVRPGGTLLVTGPSGVGKTTLLQRMADAADTRAVLVELDDPLFTGTVAGNLRLGNPALSDTETTRLLAVFGLADVQPSDRTGVDGRDLSGGELGRLRIARAVATDPPLLLVDEPLSGLDPETGRRVLAAVRTLLPDARIVYALHEAVPLRGAAILALPVPTTSSPTPV